eukprot:TRINITY_DN12458_c1_g5_i1.p1 TRINITY_DN12458_c1_g5~~TRINITY_DN12458_c1_g5_i1.p1  ORF type:complete len:202 (+),score=35.82 TRINITY_DN12458_c1_g5_i1:269-874(+)
MAQFRLERAAHSDIDEFIVVALCKPHEAAHVIEVFHKIERMDIKNMDELQQLLSGIPTIILDPTEPDSGNNCPELIVQASEELDIRFCALSVTPAAGLFAEERCIEMVLEDFSNLDSTYAAEWCLKMSLETIWEEDAVPLEIKRDHGLLEPLDASDDGNAPNKLVLSIRADTRDGSQHEARMLGMDWNGGSRRQGIAQEVP